jgi:hypothetical protein
MLLMSNATQPTGMARPTTTDQASLSPDRAFVVHFYAAAAGAEIEAGRAEHVRSGKTTHFGSWKELAAFVAQIVGT